MKSYTFLAFLVLLLTSQTTASAQDAITPISLDVKVYPDGSSLITYKVESDPTDVRVDLVLFGDSYNNLIIRDEDGFPLDVTITDSGLTVDTIGASELTIIYSTSDLTTKEGPIWNLNITSPIATKIILPLGAAIFDLGDIPIDIGNINGAQYLVMPAGEVYASFLLSIPNLSGDADEAINETEQYLQTLESQDYILTDARAKLTQARLFYQSFQFLEAKDIANQAKELADETLNVAKAAEFETTLAASKINQARDEGRTDGLSLAEATLDSAMAYFNQGMYDEAETAAKQASNLALSAESPSRGNTLLYFGLLVLHRCVSGRFLLYEE